MRLTRSPILPAALALLFLSLPGCGVVFGGTSQNVELASSPDAARVTVEPMGQELTTPTVVSLERDRDYILTLEKEGYESRQVKIGHNLRGAVLAGDILLGLVGLLVDGLTGAWFELEPKRVDVSLARASDAAAGPDSIRVRARIGEGKDAPMRVESSAPVTVRIRPVE